MNFRKGERVMLDDPRTVLVGTVIYSDQKEVQVDLGYTSGHIRTFRQKDGAEKYRQGRTLIEYIRHVSPREIWHAEHQRLRAIAQGYGQGSNLLTDLEAAITRYHEADAEYEREAPNSNP